MRFAIVGSGAVGGYYGALLVKAGFDVHFLFNSDYHHVEANGLEVESPNGNFSLPAVNAYDSTAGMPEVDVVVLALKTTQNHLLKNLLTPLLKYKPEILVLQNGLGVDRNAAELAKESIVYGGLCFLCSNKIGPGKIKHIDYGLITLGQHYSNEVPAGITDSLIQLSENLNRAEIATNLSDDIILARWQKLMWNIPFNGLCTVKDTTTDKIVGNQETRNLASLMMDEVTAAAAAHDKVITKEFKEHIFFLTDNMGVYKPSMYLDYQHKRPMEVEEIYWRPIKAAQAKGIDMPVTKSIAEQIDDLNGT
jgi:2-dehydropantoate 2-reductase